MFFSYEHNSGPVTTSRQSPKFTENSAFDELINCGWFEHCSRIRCTSLLVKIRQYAFWNFYSGRILNSFLSITVYGIDALYLLKFFFGIVTHGMAFHYFSFSCLMWFHPCVFLVSLICELHIFVWCGVYLSFFSVLSGFRIQLSLYASRLFSVVWYQITSDAVSLPRRANTSATPLGKLTNSDLSFILITHKGSNVYAEKQYV